MATAEAEKPTTKGARASEPPRVADNLHQKMCEVMAAIGAMEKDKHVDVQNASGQKLYSYDYISESSLMHAVRKELAARGVAVYVSTVGQHREGNLTFVSMQMTFADGASGQHFTIEGKGQGADSGDKGCAKAITSCMRYMLWKQFLVPTEKDDPDATTVRVPSERGDWPVTPEEAITRLNGFVEDAKPWVKEAVEAYLPDVELTNFRKLDERQKADVLRRLQVIVVDLEQGGLDPYKDADVTRSAVRAAFAKGFDGLAIQGPEPFAGPIPF